jgi:hypothetical protein
MGTYLLSYRAPVNYAPGSADTVATWSAWFDSLGASLADRGHPIFTRSTLGNCGTGTALGGYSLVTADDLEAAMALAGGCPFLRDGGGVEVGEVALDR